MSKQNQPIDLDKLSSCAGDELDEKLFNSAKELGIVEENFDEEAFKKRFFYLFIERNHDLIKTHGFIENLFEKENEESESNHFSESMKQGFLYIFSHLSNDRSKKIDFEFINNIYLLTSKSLRNQRGAKMRGKGMVSVSGVGCKDLSRVSVERIFGMINKDGGAVYYELLPNIKAGAYYAQNNKEDVHLFHEEISTDEIQEIIGKLIGCYYEKMSELTEIPSNNTDDQKIKLIAMLASDMMKLHPYLNGNGRTFCFGLLNHLLIQEKLSPCMIFDPWHIEHASLQDRVAAIKEGQEAFQEYFIRGKEVNKNPRTPITPLTNEVKIMSMTSDEIQEMEVSTITEKSIEEILNVLILYLKIKTFERLGDGKELKYDLKTRIKKLESNGQLDIMRNIGSVPMIFWRDLYESLANHKVDFVEYQSVYNNNLRLLVNEKFGSGKEFYFENVVNFIERDCKEILKEELEELKPTKPIESRLGRIRPRSNPERNDLDPRKNGYKVQLLKKEPKKKKRGR